jgi:hypothetical protein
MSSSFPKHRGAQCLKAVCTVAGALSPGSHVVVERLADLMTPHHSAVLDSPRQVCAYLLEGKDIICPGKKWLYRFEFRRYFF